MNDELRPVVTDGPWGKAKRPIIPHPGFPNKIQLWRRASRYSDGFMDTAQFVEVFNNLPPMLDLGSQRDGVKGCLVSCEAEIITLTNA